VTVSLSVSLIIEATEARSSVQGDLPFIFNITEETFRIVYRQS
jgi:hypothetical protein